MRYHFSLVPKPESCQVALDYHHNWDVTHHSGSGDLTQQLDDHLPGVHSVVVQVVSEAWRTKSTCFRQRLLDLEGYASETCWTCTLQPRIRTSMAPSGVLSKYCCTYKHRVYSAFPKVQAATSSWSTIKYSKSFGRSS